MDPTRSGKTTPIIPQAHRAGLPAMQQAPDLASGQRDTTFDLLHTLANVAEDAAQIPLVRNAAQFPPPPAMQPLAALASVIPPQVRTFQIPEFPTQNPQKVRPQVQTFQIPEFPMQQSGPGGSAPRRHTATSGAKNTGSVISTLADSKRTGDYRILVELLTEAASRGKNEILQDHRQQWQNGGREAEFVSALNERDAVDGLTPLIAATLGGHSTAVSFLLELGANPNTPNAQGETAIFLAASNGNAAIANILRKAGALVDQSTLVSAGQVKNQQAKYLTTTTTDTGALTSNRTTTYHPATAQPVQAPELVQTRRRNEPGYVDLTKSSEVAFTQMSSSLQSQLPTATDDPESAIKTALTSIMKAVEAGNNGLLGHLHDNLPHFADCINRRNEKGQTPLALAASKKNVETVKLLVRFGADINQQTDSGMTPLTLAAANGRVETLEALLNLKIDICAADGTGDTVFATAIRRGQTQVLSMLIDRKLFGVNQHIDLMHGEDNTTPLTLALTNGQLAVAKLLYLRGADPYLANANNSNAVTIAIVKRDVYLLDFLYTELKVDFNVPDKNGWTPLTLAASVGVSEVVDRLLKYGALPDVANLSGKTALEIAANSGNSDIANILLKYGASPGLISSSGIGSSTTTIANQSGVKRPLPPDSEDGQVSKKAKRSEDPPIL